MSNELSIIKMDDMETRTIRNMDILKGVILLFTTITF